MRTLPTSGCQTAGRYNQLRWRHAAVHILCSTSNVPSNDTYVFAGPCFMPSSVHVSEVSLCDGWLNSVSTVVDACRKRRVRHVCVRIRRCVHPDKLAALNLMSFISSSIPGHTSPREMFCTHVKSYPARRRGQVIGSCTRDHVRPLQRSSYGSPGIEVDEKFDTFQRTEN